MKKILAIFLVFFFLILPVQAQFQIYLPVILKGGDCMAGFAILEILDNETIPNRSDLINSDKGFHLDGWKPKIISPKGGGVFQDSTLAPHRVLVSAIDGNAVETFNLIIDGQDQDTLIQDIQELLRLLLKARNYSLNDWQDGIVGIKKQANCETSPQYAFIVNFNIPELDDPYAEPFVNAGAIALMEDVTLEIERQHWLACFPGDSECVETSSYQIWPYAAYWDERDTGAVSFTYSDILEVSGDGIYATSVDNLREIKKSLDGGDTWAVNLAGAPMAANSWVYNFLLAANGDIYAATGLNLIRTQNNGVAWAEVSTGDIYDVTELDNGYFIAVGNDGSGQGRAWRSTDGGATFNAVYTTKLSSTFQSVVQAANGDVVALDLNLNIHISIDNGANWAYDNNVEINQVATRLRKFSDDNLYVASDFYLYRSDDSGQTWGAIYQIGETGDAGLSGTAIKESPSTDGKIIASFEPIGISDTIAISEDYGLSWRTVDFPAGHGVGPASGNVILANEDLLYIISEDLFKLDFSSLAVMGRSATCTNQVMVANKSNLANFTHIKIDDGGVFTDIFPIAAFPQVLLPAVPVANDALYVGVISTHIWEGTFASAVFDLSTENTGITGTWEYYNGAWLALTVHDGTANVEAFQLLGVNSVDFAVPSDWITVAVDGITAYWIRYRVTGVAGTLQAPEQRNRDIYSVVQPWVDIDDAQVLGDIPALARIKINNRSDEDGVGGSGPNLYDNRLLVGLRSVSRGDTFNAYINLSDEQIVDGIIVAAGTNAAFANDVTTPTTRRITYSAALGDTSFVDRATISFSAGTVRDYYGIYHAFLRAKQHTGSAGEIDVRLQIRTGSGGITKTTVSKQFATTNDWQLLDFGQVRIPTSSVLSQSEIGDENVIAIQAKNTSGAARTIYFYDLILLPVDEWAVDSIDLANINGSIVGRIDDKSRLLDVDSLTNFKRDVRTLVKIADENELVVANYNAVANGNVILQANADQRYWFLMARYGSSDEWVSEPWYVHSVQVWKNERYLGLRGAR